MERDCQNCKHRIMKVEIGKGTPPEHFWGCELWECEFEQNIEKTIDDLEVFETALFLTGDKEHSRDIKQALDIIRKFQKIEQICKENCDLFTTGAIEKVKEVIEPQERIGEE